MDPTICSCLARGFAAVSREIEATAHCRQRVVPLVGVEIGFDSQAHALLRNADRPGMIGTVGSPLGGAGSTS